MNIEFERIINRWVITAAILFAVFLSVLTYYWITLSAPAPQNAAGLLAIVTDIPLPPSEQAPVPTPTFDPYAPPPTPTLGPGEFALDSFVQISGTQGEGLRIRTDPGLNGRQLFLAFDTEVYKVKDGPRQLDGYIWYQLEAVNDQRRIGWAASTFLTPIINP
ncbi:MAG: SH3 domain-containing protein [Chloroflexota bacterium]